MDNQIHSAIVSFIWGIADDCLRDVYVRGKYRDVILPMTVIRRLDALLEDSKEAVLDMKKRLTEAKIDNQYPALCNAAGQAFCNASPFRLRDLTSRPTKQKLKADFEAYLDGFSPNVQEILDKFKFRNQIDTMIEADILGAVIEKFISSDINLSPNPIYKDEEKTMLRLPGLDNHGMGTIFEELIRRFNEENNEEAGEHWTPRDVVELMADLIFLPVADRITDATYSCYELLISIMSSLAQEESRSISENVTWGQRKRFADGKVSFAYSRFLGLDKDKETGKIVVNQEQAETVKLIYHLFLEGMTPHSIATELTSREIKTPTGKDVWNQQTVRRILSNEKYKGDALLQKEFIVDFLQKKMKKNEGEVPQYYVEGNHEAIISPAVFDLVQVEIEKRNGKGTRYSGVSIFSNKIKCADCGSWFGSKVWHSTDQYRRVIYRCNRKYNGEKCQTPHVTNEEVKAAFVAAYNKLVIERKEIIANAELIRRTLCDTTSLQEEKQRLESEMAVLVDIVNNCIAENACIAQDQEEYQKRYDSMVARYDAAKAKYDETIAAISAKEAQNARLTAFTKALRERDGIIVDFDESLWGCMVEYVTVGRKKEMTVTFRDGTEIQA